MSDTQDATALKNYREFPGHKTMIDHYPLAEGQVVVRWRNHWSDPDQRGYIVEACVGGMIVEGGGHYGGDLWAARRAGQRLANTLRSALSQEGEGEPDSADDIALAVWLTLEQDRTDEVLDRITDIIRDHPDFRATRPTPEHTNVAPEIDGE